MPWMGPPLESSHVSEGPPCAETSAEARPGKLTLGSLGALGAFSDLGMFASFCVRSRCEVSVVGRCEGDRRLAQPRQ